MKYYCYVIELENSVLKNKIFRFQNPNYINGNKCFYVGQSFESLKLDLNNTKEGYKANKYAKKIWSET